MKKMKTKNIMKIIKVNLRAKIKINMKMKMKMI